MDYVTLSNGLKMPQLGYGVFQVKQEECERCVMDALSVGYRSIDTAQIYGNEAQVGSAIQKSGVPREEIFLTTKVWPSRFGDGTTRKSVYDSMERLRTDYLDLVLLHHPFSDIYGAWRDLEALYEEGVVRAIGVSNFYEDRLIDLLSFNTMRPMVNQLELHPYYQREELLRWTRKYGVQPEAWAPFGEGKGGLFKDPVLVSVGKKYGKTSAQVTLRWNLQRGVVVIPKSTHIERMRENLDVFDFVLTDEDMAVISALDKDKTAFMSYRDPEIVEVYAKRCRPGHEY